MFSLEQMCRSIMVGINAELKIDVLNAFSTLQDKLESLGQALDKDQGLTAWMQPAPPLLSYQSTTLNPRPLAFAALSQLEYADQQEPRETLVCPGFIGASQETIDLAQQLNEAKDIFKQAVLRLRQAKGSLKDLNFNDQNTQNNHARNSQLSSSLQKMGLSRLHLKQCYRKIPILKHAPIKISWTWAHTRSIKRITVEQAQRLLQKKSQDSGIQHQLSLLAQVPAHENLAIVQELAPHLRANILLPKDTVAKPRLMVKGPIPIFFPAGSETPAPQFKPPGEKLQKDINRLIRNDVKIDPNPFLPAIRAHRYTINNALLEMETE